MAEQEGPALGAGRIELAEWLAEAEEIETAVGHAFETIEMAPERRGSPDFLEHRTEKWKPISSGIRTPHGRWISADGTPVILDAALVSASPSLRAERSNPGRRSALPPLDCFATLAMTANRHRFTPGPLP